MATYRPKLAGGLSSGETVFVGCVDTAVKEVVYDGPSTVTVILANGHRIHCRYDRLFYVPMPNRRLVRWRFDRTK